jgi:DNA-binding transcriptional LysR family regulator
MEMQQVRYFLALAKHLNFTRAAEDCGVSQPALTRAVQALEAELGGELLRRERRTSHLTDLGRRMLPFLQQCFDSAMSAKALARSVSASELAPFTLALSHTVPIELAMKPLAELFRALPGLQLKLLHACGPELLTLLREGLADMAIAGPLGQGWDRLDVWPLREEGFVLLAPGGHPLASAAEVRPEDLTQLAMFSLIDCESTEEVSGWLAARGVSGGHVHQVTSQAQLTAMLAQGLGGAIVAESLAPPEGAVARPVAGFTLRRHVSAYTVAGRARSMASNLLLNLLRAAADCDHRRTL